MVQSCMVMRGERAHIAGGVGTRMCIRALRHGAAAVINACGGQRRLRTCHGHAQRHRDPCGGRHILPQQVLAHVRSRALLSGWRAQIAAQTVRLVRRGFSSAHRRPAGRHSIPAPGMAARYSMALQCHGRAACVLPVCRWARGIIRAVHGPWWPAAALSARTSGLGRTPRVPPTALRIWAVVSYVMLCYRLCYVMSCHVMVKGPDEIVPTFDTLGALMPPYRLAMRSPLHQR